MGRGKKAKRKARQQERRKGSRNAKRRELYSKRNVEEQKSPGVERKEEPKSRVIRDIKEAYETAGYDWGAGNVRSSISSTRTERWQKEFEHALNMSDSVILEKGFHPNFEGGIYKWGLDYERKFERCPRFVYTIKGKGLPLFVAQVVGISYVFFEGHCSEEERDQRLYQEALKRSQKFAEKNGKEFVNETGRNNKSQLTEKL